MLEFEVNSRRELQAAIRAAAQPTYEAARQNPVRITWGRFYMSFKEGIHESRAERMVRQANQLGRKSSC